jgi:hypothetical protein
MRTEKQIANLIPIRKGQLSKEEIKERGSNGGKKSVEKRRELKEIREWAEQNLFTVRGNDKTPLYELLFKKLEQLCIQGNIKAIEMLLNYSGLKPIDKVENINPTIQKVFITKKDTEEADKLIDEFINE